MRIFTRSMRKVLAAISTIILAAHFSNFGLRMEAQAQVLTDTINALEPSSFALNGSYIDLPNGRYSWSFGASLQMQLQAFNENAPEGSTFALAADVLEGGRARANAKIPIPLR